MTPELTHKRERRKEARPGELLEAALQLFVQKGFAATKVEEVAALAGVSKGTLFLYFPTKEDLLKAVVSENLAQHFPAWNQAFETFEGSSAEMLRFALHSWWEKIGSTPASGICKLMLSESRNFPDLLTFYVDSVIRPGNHLLQRILERGMANGEFRPLNADIAVHTIVAPMIFLMIWENSMTAYSSSLSMAPLDFLEHQIEVLLHGLVAPSKKA
jgi:AcrR family transcriptional regulator